ncbi:gas vesicle protein [Streptomyces griseus]|uniref:gas vesicle protein n=1 Tax=Streptomyces griseus TaxID=1911 RepID=UPI00083FE81F|nr:gas vesicle protein [Streptomyces griseus]
MSDSLAGRMGNSSGVSPYGQQGSSANLADILERVLDKGIVIAGDIKINLLDIELLTIKLRLLVASVDKAKEMGIDWWEHDPSLSSRARPEQQVDGGRAPSGDGQQGALAEENARLRAEITELRAAAGLTAGSGAHTPEPLPGTAGESEGEERQ